MVEPLKTHQLRLDLVQLVQNPRHRAYQTKEIKERKAAQRILEGLQVNFPCSSKVGAKGTQRRRANAAARITRSIELLKKANFSTEENIPLSFDSNII